MKKREFFLKKKSDVQTAILGKIVPSCNVCTGKFLNCLVNYFSCSVMILENTVLQECNHSPPLTNLKSSSKASVKDTKDTTGVHEHS